jgi:flagellar biosynthesis/type III secretory pathway chaperone
MRQESELEKLQQKLDQTRRLAAVAPDPTTRERLAQMVEELSEKLRTLRKE